MFGFVNNALRGAIKVERSVRRLNYKRRGNQPYGYVEDQWTEQHLIVSIRVFGLLLFRRIADREVVPEHVLIEIGSFGSSEWRSKFAAFIPAR